MVSLGFLPCRARAADGRLKGCNGQSGYEATDAGYAVIVKQGIRIAHEEFVANEERQELAVVRRLALKRAGDLAAKSCSTQQPEVSVLQGEDLLSYREG